MYDPIHIFDSNEEIRGGYVNVYDYGRPSESHLLGQTHESDKLSRSFWTNHRQYSRCIYRIHVIPKGKKS